MLNRFPLHRISRSLSTLEIRGAGRAARGFARNSGKTIRAVLGFGRFFGDRFFEMVDSPDYKENDNCHNQEVDDCIDEKAIIQGGCTSLLSVRPSGIISSTQVDVETSEIDFTQQQTDGRHDEIVDQ